MDTPSLTLFLGPPNSGKLGRVMAWWRERLALRPLVVAPTAEVAHEITADMARRSGAVFGQTEAVTFDGLVREVLGYAPAYVSEFERQLLLAGLLATLPLSSLAGSLGFPGLVTALAPLLGQFAESGQDPEEVAGALGLWADTDAQDAALAGDLEGVMRAYLSACTAAGLAERGHMVREAANRLAGWTRPVAFYGFTSFTGGQGRLILRLAACGPVLITFDHERGRTVNLVSGAEVARWESGGAVVVECPPQPQAYSSPAIAHLERQLAAEQPLTGATFPADEGQGVHFLLAAGERSEAELAAQHVARLLAGGFSPGDIAVVVRNTRARGRVLGQVFASCGIPYRLDARVDVEQTGLGGAFLNAVRGAALDDSGALLAYLHSPYSGLSWQEATEISRRYRRAASGEAAILPRLVEEARPGALAAFWPAPAAAASPSAGAPASPPMSPPTPQLAGLQAFALQLLTNGLRAWPADSAEVEADVLAYKALSAALAAAARVAGSGAVPAPDLRLLLEHLGRVVVPSDAGHRHRAVSILSPSRARARRFTAVFVLGLVEGEFPGRPALPSLLTDAQRRALDAAAGGGLLAPAEDEEQALFVSSVSRAWQLLYLSARDADDSGGEVLPSHFWTQAKTVLGRGADEHEKRTLADVVFSVERAPSERHLRRARAAAAARPAGLRDPWRRSPAGLQHPRVLADMAAASSFSPSALERYLSCPFAWFLEKVVGVEELSEEPDGRVIGTLLHKAASRVYRQLIASDDVPLRPDTLAAALRLAHHAVDELVAGDDCPGTPAQRRIAAWRLKHLVGRLLAMEAAGDGALVPTGAEVEVGGRDGVDVGGVRVRGRLDRLDVDPADGALFVVDYKTGALPGRSKLGTADGLQLPLYLLALAAEHEGAKLAGGAYVSPGEQKVTGVVLGERSGLGGVAGACPALDEEAAAILLHAAAELAVQAAAGMRAGEIAPLPERSCSSRCSLRTACRAFQGSRYL